MGMGEVCFNFFDKVRFIQDSYLQFLEVTDTRATVEFIMTIILDNEA